MVGFLALTTLAYNTNMIDPFALSYCLRPNSLHYCGAKLVLPSMKLALPPMAIAICCKVNAEILYDFKHFEDGLTFVYSCKAY